ncbi:unnamed protein product, partial [marine sediment metagenome]
ALDIARQRARRRGLEDKITWVRASLLDLPDSGLGPFDYINCSGVLHHLDSPADGLAALTSVLKDDGALGLMLYGRYGRTGVYQMQQLMRLINHGEHRSRAMVENTKEVLASLPNTNWLKRTPTLIGEKDQLDDAEIFDIFLHAKDRPYSVLEVYDLLDRENLHLVEFLYEERAMYDYQFAFRGEGLQRQVARLPRRYQQAAAELFWGTLDRHKFWASRHTDTTADARDPQNVPVFSKLAESIGMPESIVTTVNSSSLVWRPSIDARHGMTISFNLELNDVNRQLVRLIDGRHTMGEIVRTITSGADSPTADENVWNLCCETLESLRKFDFVVLHHESVPGIDKL